MNMRTLDELIFYCRQENPVGAMALLGESGSGKTRLIEKDLQAALRDTHFIVRTSLFGIASIDALHTAVKKQWLCSCTPFLAKMEKHRDKMEKGQNFVRFLNSILKGVSPTVRALSETISNPLDYFVITPVAEDYLLHEKKKVILVFDDVDRTKLDWTELLGCINEYCENQNFNTIIIANREFLNETDPEVLAVINSAKEKTVAYSVLNCPDFENTVQTIIAERSWKSEEYAEFLKDHEQAILEVFSSDSSVSEEITADLVKHHNVRCLITALERFFRIYYHFTRAGVQDLAPYLCSFLAYYLAIKSGISKNRATVYDASDEDISRLYHHFSPEFLFDSVRQWIHYHYWDRNLFFNELSRISDVDLSEIADDEEDDEDNEPV